MNLTLFPNETSIFESKYTSLEAIQLLKENTFEGTISSTAHKTNKIPYLGILSNTLHAYLKHR